MTYTVEPTEHWRAGDRAYCVRGLKYAGRHLVETGRIYLVEEVLQMNGMMNDGLKLAGINTGEVFGFWSSRFACIRGQASKQLDQRIRYSWSEAYTECRDARNAQGIAERATLDPTGEKA